MRQAKSVYFGGDITEARDCDYSSSKELGLTCPFCSNAVFLTRGYHRTLRGKPNFVEPFFSHYDGMGSDCENRSLTKAGKDEVEKIKKEARNQRLKLYNAYLWRMLTEDISVIQSDVTYCQSAFKTLVGSSRYESFCENAKKRLKSRGLQEVFDSMQEFVVSSEAMRERDKIGFLKGEHYFDLVDLKFHRLVCEEVRLYLMSDSAKPLFSKFITLSFIREIQRAYAGETPSDVAPLFLEGFALVEKDLDLFLRHAGRTLFALPWIELITKFAKMPKTKNIGFSKKL